jgi:hypothetical protein
LISSDGFDVNDVVEDRVRSLAPVRRIAATSSGIPTKVRGDRLVDVAPLPVIDDVAAVLVAVQIDGNETRLRRCKTDTLFR